MYFGSKRWNKKVETIEKIKSGNLIKRLNENYIFIYISCATCNLLHLIKMMRFKKWKILIFSPFSEFFAGKWN